MRRLMRSDAPRTTKWSWSDRWSRWGDRSAFYIEPFGDDLIVEVLAASDGPAFDAGTQVSYSNTGYVLMTETRYRDDRRERIPRPFVLRDGSVSSWRSANPLHAVIGL